MILAIETSCDESAVAWFDPAAGLRGEWIHSQIALHARHGGVVPDLASREHLRTLEPLLAQARAASGHFQGVTQIAVTQGPGLAGCLAVGLASAKALALALGVPVQGVNHLRGHVWSPFISLHAAAPGEFERQMADHLPHLALVVSGGNTLLAVLDEDRSVKVWASTRDDAAGEALDKGAKLLGLGYPGGPIVERQAAAGGRADAFDFPRGLGPRAELDFSFSGLKTALRYQLEKMTPATVAAALPDLCASYQQAVVDALVRKAGLALARGLGGRPFRSLGLSGGVANNRCLRVALGAMAARQKVRLLAAEPQHTGDNAGMIAFAAWADRASQPRGLGPGEGGAELEIKPGWDVGDARA